MTSSPANAADPVADCKVAYPVADLVADLAAEPPVTVTGLTVDTGTTPEVFTGEVIGVLHDGIAPGLPMVMARLSSPEIDRVGIWAGMSGSPVYAENGDLIGAVAYGLAWGPSPVAGITPFEEMDKYMTAPAPARIEIDDRLARRIASETDVTARQASEGFSQLPMSVSVSGLSQRRLDQMQGKKAPRFVKFRGARAMGAASSAAAATPDDLVAGGNLGAALSTGDITAGGVGTVTSVCNDRLVGFGHPFGYFGKTTLGLMPAEAIYVQEDLITGFKVANLGDVAGTIDQDRLAGITGSLGAAPEGTVISSDVAYGTDSRPGGSESYIQSYDASITFSQILANHDRVLDAFQAGSEAATFSIKGIDANGNDFNIAWRDRYVSSYDISFDSAWEVADTVWLLSRMTDVDIQSVTATAVVSDNTSVWRLRSVQQKRGAKWVTLGRRQPAVVNPGGTLQLRAQLTRGSSTKTVPLALAVPRKTSNNGFLEVTGGLSMWDNGLYGAKTPVQMEAAVAAMTKNDQVNASLRFFKRGPDIIRKHNSQSQSLAVRGGTWAEVLVRR